MAITREEAIKRLTDGHQALHEMLSAASEEQRPEEEQWSAVDLRGHIATWEELALNTLRQWVSGQVPDAWEKIEAAGGIDGFNAAELERKRALPSSDVTAGAEEVHSSLVAEIRAAKDEQWESMPFWETEHQWSLGEALGRITGGRAKGGFAHAFDHLEDQAASS